MSDAIKNVRVVIFKEGDGWIAQCVEYDICAQGKDLSQVHRRIIVALQEEARYTLEASGVEFAGIDPAPDYFESMFSAAQESLAADVEMRIAA